MPLKYEFNEGQKGKRMSIPEDPPAQEEINLDRYNEPGHLRAITFQDNNGKESTQFYAWLSSVHFDPATQEMILEFGKVHIFIKGRNLIHLREEIAAQRIKKVEPVNPRYAQIVAQHEYAVTEVSFKQERIEKKKDNPS